MKTIQIYDPAMCCSSGVCGIEVDQTLVNLAADVEWAQQQGAQITRFNLAQEPLAFASQPVVKAFLERSGQEGLPLILVGGEVALAALPPQLRDWSQAQLARKLRSLAKKQQAAAPDQVASLAMSCCDLVLACCDAAMSCCP